MRVHSSKSCPTSSSPGEKTITAFVTYTSLHIERPYSLSDGLIGDGSLLPIDVFVIRLQNRMDFALCHFILPPTLPPPSTHCRWFNVNLALLSGMDFTRAVVASPLSLSHISCPFSALSLKLTSHPMTLPPLHLARVLYNLEELSLLSSGFCFLAATCPVHHKSCRNTIPVLGLMNRPISIYIYPRDRVKQVEC